VVVGRCVVVVVVVVVVGSFVVVVVVFVVVRVVVVGFVVVLVDVEGEQVPARKEHTLIRKPETTMFTTNTQLKDFL
jgi:hypothetical protein